MQVLRDELTFFILVFFGKCVENKKNTQQNIQ